MRRNCMHGTTSWSATSTLAMPSWRPASVKEAAEHYRRLFRAADQAWQEALRAAQRRGASGPTRLPDPALEEIRQILYGPDAPTHFPRAEVEEYLLDRASRDQVRQLK